METMRGDRERSQDLKYRLKEKTKREALVVEEDGEDDDEEEEEEEEDWLGSGEDDKKRRTVRRSSTGNGGGGVSLSLSLSPPKCQVEKCTVVLSEAKKYHRRHKVCEIHSKASFVIVAGIRQRFCQQCSRFHQLSEFDESKRSCRSRLAGHNERRRKNSSESTHGEGSSRKGTGPIIASRLTKVGGC